MKFCSKCGKELHDEAIICPGCGCAADDSIKQTPMAPRKESGLQLAAKILMIISTASVGLFLLPLAWMLPMTISYCKKIKKGEPVSTGFKICTLLFVNTVAGILMLCDEIL